MFTIGAVLAHKNERNKKMIEVRDNLTFYHVEAGRVLPMRHEHLYEALGLNPKRHLPVAGLEPKWIGNVLVTVLPKDPNKAQDAARCVCSCPTCGKFLTAGKLHQHMKVHR
jgi:hypothetical protein